MAIICNMTGLALTKHIQQEYRGQMRYGALAVANKLKFTAKSLRCPSQPLYPHVVYSSTFHPANPKDRLMR